MQTYKQGDTVNVVDNFNGSERVVCKATVVRTTKTLVITKNEHGNEGRYYIKNGKQVGYAWPYLTNLIKHS